MDTQESDGKAVALLDALDRGRQALVEADDYLKVFRVQQGAAAYAAAAKVLERRDIEVKATLLMADAERMLVKSTPAAPVGRPADQKIREAPGISQVAENVENADPGQKLKDEAEARKLGRVLAEARKAHADLPDEKYEEIRNAADKYQEPLSRNALVKATRQHRQETGQASPPRSQRITDPNAIDPQPPAQLAPCQICPSKDKRIASLEDENTDLKDELAQRSLSADAEQYIDGLKAQVAALTNSNNTLMREKRSLQGQVNAMKKKYEPK